MANKPIEMSKIRQILRLYSKGLGKKKIADRIGSSRNTVRVYIEAFIRLRTTIDQVLKLPDVDLNNLFHPPGVEYSHEKLSVLLGFFPEAEKLLEKANEKGKCGTNRPTHKAADLALLVLTTDLPQKE